MIITDQSDGSEYPVDPSRLTWVEGEVIEKHSGLTIQEWSDKINAGSLTAKRALIFVAVKRVKPQLRWGELDDRPFNDFQLDFTRGPGAIPLEELTAQAEGDDALPPAEAGEPAPA